MKLKPLMNYQQEIAGRATIFFGTPCTYDSAKLWYTIQLKISSMVHSAAKI